MYVLSEIRLRGLAPNSYIHVFMSDLFISRIGLPIWLQQNRQTDLEIYKSLRDTWWTFCFGNNESMQFHFWEHLNRNQTFILVSHQPFIFSVENRH
jgi:hypothetical protein